ncbi:MAG: SoxR reducing system RseC family protein [Candidatus Thiodiazotropha sp. (ex Cardiolucina cf. quadrata)]|nr:SoxR reducing system RseC family protein [Candidatus Thiodiazotropha sp. (ex Cardiolucina cf. quadrata)]
MIEEPATVISIDDEHAVVETEQRPACGACTDAGGCSTSLISGLFKRRHSRLRVSNPIHARPGQRVIIGVQENALLKVSFLAYLLPLVCMILMAILTQAAATLFIWQIGELPQVVGGLLGLIGGFILLRQFAGQKQNEPGYQAVILRLAGTVNVEFSKEYIG